MPKHRYRVGSTYVSPYLYFFGAIGAFDRLEVNGRITQVLNVPGFDKDYGSGYERFSRTRPRREAPLLKEGNTPRRGREPFPTRTAPRLYASQVDRRVEAFFPFDFTLGIGKAASVKSSSTKGERVSTWSSSPTRRGGGGKRSRSGVSSSPPSTG
jgi:hypothetical protein